MAKYYKFTYNAGYAGTDVETTFKFPDDWTDKDVSKIFEEWYDEQNTSSGDYEELDCNEIDEDDIDEDYCD